jgi:hypothetical protein
MTAGQYNVGWTPFAGAPTVQIADLSGGAYDTPSIASFFGGNPTGIDFDDPSCSSPRSSTAGARIGSRR